MGLADAEAAVEVETGTGGRRLLPEQAASTAAADLHDLLRELLRLLDRGGLAGFCGIGMYDAKLTSSNMAGGTI